MSYLGENPQEVKNAAYYRRQVKRLEEESRLLKPDAERYRWLREQHWDDSELAVVSNPKKTVQLGTFCPSEELLDETIDAAMLVVSNRNSHD